MDEIDESNPTKAGTEGDPELPPGFGYGTKAEAAAEENKENGMAEHTGPSAPRTATASAISDGSQKATTAASGPAGQDEEMLQQKLKGLQSTCADASAQYSPPTTQEQLHPTNSLDSANMELAACFRGTHHKQNNTCLYRLLTDDVEEGEGEAGVMDEPERESALHDAAEDTIRTVPAGDTPYTSATSFDDLPIPRPLLQGLFTEMKFEKPSRIQATTLPMVLTPPYRSLIAQAHNGSGKTTCFILGMLARVDPDLAAPQALCVCPTRELVVQNLQVLERMAKFTKITATSTANSDFEFSRNTRITDQVVIGTHGKLKNWMSKRILQTKNIKILVFDEADEMLKTDAFASDSVRMINELRRGNPDLQILLFSATFNDTVKNFAMKVVRDANQVFVPREQLSLDVIKQYRVYCPKPMDKIQVLKDMIFPQCEKLGQTIIFVRTRETARLLHTKMEGEGHRCTSIEGSMDKVARDAVVKEFRDGTTKILISTDVLSRGFDVTQVTLVINFDVPTERDLRRPAYETYLHRIGRSGRFGRRGAAFNLICGPAEKAVLDAIQDYFQHDIPEVPFNDEDAFLDVLKKAGLTDGN